jgi:hypothetical protein
MSAPEEMPVVEVKAEVTPEPAPAPPPEPPPFEPPVIFHVVSWVSNEKVDYEGFSALPPMVALLKKLAYRSREDMNVLVFQGQLLSFTDNFPDRHPYLILADGTTVPLFSLPAPGPATKSRQLCMPKMEAAVDYTALTTTFGEEIVATVKDVPKKDGDDDDEKLGPES